MAALEGGLTFQKGLGAVHALSHPLGGLKAPSLHHGTLNAVLLPAVLRFNELHAVAKYEVLRRTLQLLGRRLPARLLRCPQRSPGTASEPGADGRARGLPGGVIARNATLDHSAATNPRPASEAEFLALLNEAMG